VRITVKRERCIGAGQCARTAPYVFDCDESGVARILDARATDECEAEVRLAVQLCPVRAIALSDGSRGGSEEPVGS
jgi:ferredoxin